MKLTKKLEAEILKVYYEVWDAYLRGDMRTFASILDENCYIIGSAAGEIFSNKKAAVKYYKATAAQITGKAEFRNRKIKMMPVEKGVMVNEQSDFYLLIDDHWTFYGPARISSLFHKKNNKWKVIHQHGSFPDSKTEEGEQVNTDKIKAENIQLRNAVKRRTEELESKNRELEIETSLEKVRAQALGMYKPDDLLNVCRALFKELSLLGFNDIRNAIIHTYNDEENYFIDYDYSDLTGGSITNISYNSHPVIKRFLKQIRSDEAFAEITIKGKELNEWKKFRKSGGQPDDPGLDKTSALYYYFHSVGTGDIGISTFSSINEEKLQLLKRFRNVFELAYKRYTDITKAETQAREAQIEAALERVRSRSMAMHKSDDLHEVIKVVVEQLSVLSVKFNVSNFAKIDPDGSWDLWLSTPEQTYPALIHVPYIDHPIFSRITEEGTKGNDFFTDVYSQEEANTFFHHFFENTVARNTPEERKQFVYNSKGFTRSIFLTKNIWFSVARYDATSFTDEENAIFKRFANVFEQAYTRFLDLQKAEAQARETEIELSLERVRAKTMAMQKPSEFADIINIIGEQFLHLGFDIDWVNFGANGFTISEGIDIWNFAVVPGTSPISARVFIPYFDHPVFTTSAASINEFTNGGKDFTVVTLDKQTKDTWLDHLFTKTIFKDVPGEYRAIQYAKPGYTTSNISLKDTWLSIGKFDIKNFTDEQQAILRRFANAFGQAYTRFQDLQNAEAQAKEAQIEAALERVRARSMAMHHSSELHAAADVLFQQLRIFGGDIMNAGIALCTQDADEDEYWLSSDSGLRPVISIPHTEDSVQKKLYEDWKNKSEFFSIAKGGDELKAHYNYMQSVPSLKPFFKEGPDWSFPTWQKWHAAYFSHGYLFMITLKPYEEEKILVRFAKVFEQAYTRFLDLQKAEAQAREAQIEASLERVRSRAMAMQSSEQLRELIGTVFTELTKLDIVLTRCLIMIYDPKSNDSVWWMANSEAPTQPIGLKVHYHEYPSYLAYVNAWNQKELKWTYTLEGNTKKEWDDFLFVETELSHLPDFVIAGMKAPDRVYLNASFNSFGNLTLATLEPLSDEHFDIMLRFAKVFDLTYTRFNDLKQAEAQAKEARIEVALERVRARTMAMQKPGELADAAQILYREFATLNIKTFSCGYMFIDEEKHTQTAWVVLPDGTLLPNFIVFPLTGDHVLDNRYKDWKEKKPLHLYEIQGEVNKEHHKFLSNHVPSFVVKDIFSKVPERIIFHCANFSNGYLLILATDYFSQEEQQTVIRFAKVFEMTYTRFLDLKQAEAQTREAQIELALERVRARTMAMHKSEELAETSQVLFHQLRELGGIPDRISIGIADEVKGIVDFWTTDQQGSHLDHSFSARLNERTTIAKTYQAWKEHKKSLVLDLHGEDLKEWIKFAREEMGIVVRDDQIKDRRVHSLAFFSHGWILATSHEPQSTETIQILERFASVFNLTYRRFLDLKKAEAQAREAQIEAALEKVRSRSLAMHKSDELQEVVDTVFERLQDLNIEMASANIAIFKEGTRDYDYWIASPAQKRSAVFHLPYTDLSLTRDLIAARESGKEFSTTAYSFEEKNEWFEYAFKSTDFKFLSEERQQFILNAPAITVAIAFSKNTGVQVNRYNNKLYTEGEGEILKRFSKVFEQAYIRFLDLEKAEAQGREAQIEAALERVRSSSLAMHKSEELKDVVKIVFENFRSLGLQNIDSVNINIFHEGSRDFDLWLAAPGQDYTTNFRLPYLDHPIANDFFNDVKKGETIHKGIYDHDLKNKYFEYMFEYSDNKHLPEERKKLILSGRAYSVATGIAKHSSIFIHNYNGEKFSDETNGILVKFSKVFDQAYTRFLDLQKAEAQAREAQIETVLERVRSRTMAMQKSDELTDVAGLLFEQVSALGIKTWTAGFNVWSEDNNSYVDYITSPQGGFIEPYTVYTDTAEALTDLSNARKSGVEFDVQYVEGEKIKQLYLALTKLDEKQYQIMLQDGGRFPSHQYEHFVFGSKVSLMFITYEPVPEAHDIFKRLGKVFEQTYTRFLDLQKAEAQAREAQIEASLERVRSKTMAMHNSQDVGETVAVMFDELRKLDIQTLRCGVGIMLENYQMELWTARPDATGNAEFIVGHIDMKLHPLLTGGYEAWKNKADGFFYQLKDEDLKTYFDAINSHQAYAAKYDISSLPPLMFHYEFNFNEGCLFAFSIKEFSDEFSQIFKRFTGVFGQTYRRYLDLQKAEANAREAKIEASLERVRAKAMAMHSSKDLAETLGVFYRELKSLSVIPIRCGVALMDKDTRMAELTTMNTTGQGDSIEIIGKIKMAGHPVLDGVFENWLIKKEYHAILRGNQIKEYYQVLKPQIDYLDYSHDEVQFGYYFMFNEGDVYAWTEKELTDDELTIYRRFTSVISLTYKRYKDLQQAEAQAREAKIEAGLERVRARTMAMHSSEDVGAATATMFTELEKLGIQNLRGGITIIKAGDKQEVWGVTNLPDGKTIRSIGEFDMHLHPLWRELLKAKLNNGDYNYYRLAGKDKEDYLDILNATPNYLSQPIKDFPDVHVQSYFFGEGAIWTNSLQPHSEEDKQVMKRFASVFSLTFRRYQDLKKAEAQTREATIEAALEKVRGKAMAMHNSNDLSTTASIVFTELRKLGISPIRCGVGLLNKESRKGQIYAATSSNEEDSLSLVGWVQLSGHPVLEKIYDTWKNNEDYFPELNGEQMKTYYDLLLSGLSVSVPDTGEKQYGTFLPFSVGCLYAWSDTPYNDSELKILKRFASIIDLTFRRYIELQKSEATAKEAIKQAALDRIRADIASMRTINDLDRITPLIWNELTVLGIPFIRCGVFIMDEEPQLIHTFLSTPDGKAIAAFHLPYDTPGNLNHVVANWKKNKKYIDHWDESEFKQFAEILMKQGALVSAEQYLKTIPKGGFYLHFLPFLQGMLYVGNTNQLKEEEIELIQHVADAFSTAYARYEDFNKLEAAKQQVEKTLTDLKQAQTQLVQSEKMASLGEMTAGIAHEIQNPLNFVNNFSEVSKELLDEMKTELEIGNTEDAKGIADDVIQNLEKINHHGKRADAIVKSMLQHSRSSSGKKEPTDINSLADEYLRLAYHGLRAKDKSFNAKFETEFDDSIGKINIISQDIGRVLVNLINNAFYAVSERKKQESNGYEPTVEVLTKKTDDKIEIKVKDNGNGIPQKVLDKIFQPFFTTKPTGQGTGLGLSLAYDIVTKGHGGELKVETKEGEGSEFIIQLPVNQTSR
ncbi:MAG TPA: ATP-binding protein [Chitinophagaceae bacterium]|nr:ATP-binding protein [Chitinophagaceae bacterium]